MHASPVGFSSAYSNDGSFYRLEAMFEAFCVESEKAMAQSPFFPRPRRFK